MKIRPIIIFGLLLLLNACSWQGQNKTSPQKIEDPLLKPVAPTVQASEPISPLVKSEIDFTLQLSESEQKMEDITEENLRQGWYNGEKNQKKYATPDSWVWQKGQKDQPSRWIHPDLLEVQRVVDEELLCRKSAGTYIKSCNQLEEGSECQYIPQSSCQCPSQTLWDPEGGCLAVDSEKQWVMIEEKELEQGYYFGLSSGKKKGTPPTWFWNSEKIFWQSPFYYPNSETE